MIELAKDQWPHADQYTAVVEVMKLAEENRRLRQTVAAQSAIVETLQRELAASRKAAGFPA